MQDRSDSSKSANGTFRVSFKEKIKRKAVETFYKIYSLDYYKWFHGELNNYVDSNPPLKSHILKFFGLIGEHDNTPQNFRQFLKNFLAFPAKAYSPVYKLGKILLILPTILFHIVRIPFQTIRNILRFFTEYLPLFVYTFLGIAMDKLSASKLGKDSYIGTTLKTSLLVLEIVFLLIFFVARAVTSPIVNVQESYKAGKEFHPLLGAFLALISISISIAAYILIFPVALKGLAIALPTATADLSAFLVAKMPWLFNIGEFIITAGHTITTSVAIQGFYSFVVGSIEAILGASSLLVAAALIAESFYYILPASQKYRDNKRQTIEEVSQSLDTSDITPSASPWTKLLSGCLPCFGNVSPPDTNESNESSSTSLSFRRHRSNTVVLPNDYATSIDKEIAACNS